MSRRTFPQVRRLDLGALRERIAQLELDLHVDDQVDPKGPLAATLQVGGKTVGNRFAILPMEGWDATRDGAPTPLVERRWARFGSSGAKLIWGGEAVAVRADGRANPHQLLLDATTEGQIAALRQQLVDEHVRAHGRADDLVVGLQLTHSGRFSRPDGAPAPVIGYHHPVLDRRVQAEEVEPISDDALDDLVPAFVDAARRARDVGFDFVDLKHCHGYLLHELLTGVDRPGRYGGDFEGRTAFSRAVVSAVRDEVPELNIGVRLSLFDVVPYEPGADRVGRPAEAPDPYRLAFGGDGSLGGIELTETHRLLDVLTESGVSLLCTTAGSPYYNPHVQRPAYFPPSDGYEPPEDPLVGVARQLSATARVKAHHPNLVVVGSAYSYLQEWLANVAQHEVRAGHVDVIGLGRMALSYPELPSDVLAGRSLTSRKLCRTFSDCTTAPRNGLVSGCYPLDPFYKAREERVELARVKREQLR